MNGKEFVEKLRKLENYALVFTRHAELRLAQRQIAKELVVNHLRNPDSLGLVEPLAAGRGEEKYKLWFVPYKRIAYIYVIVINHFQCRIIIKTVVKQQLMWQKKVERHVR